MKATMKELDSPINVVVIDSGAKRVEIRTGL